MNNFIFCFCFAFVRTKVVLPRFATGKARIYARARATQQPDGVILIQKQTIEIATFGSQIPAVHSIWWYDSCDNNRRELVPTDESAVVAQEKAVVGDGDGN